MHFGVLCPESPGHMNPMNTLLAELVSRGHTVTWFGLLDAAEDVKRLGYHSVVVGKKDFPLGSRDRIFGELGRRKGVSAAMYTIRVFRQAVEVGLREGPQPIRDSGVQALIIDEAGFTARTVSEMTELPYISVCNALPFHPDPDLPPTGLAWSYGKSSWHRLRNRFGYAVSRFMMRGIRTTISRFRDAQDLPRYDIFEGNISPLATLAQIHAEFDFPRSKMPETFHYIGGLHNASSREPVDFPYDQLDGRPLVYASLGTAQNRILKPYHRIAEACQSLPVQLVISMGGGADPADLGPLPGNPIVVPFAPQLDLITRSQLVITHAGMNTVAESVAAGKPMVALPVTNDQPSVAARVARIQCGIMVPLRNATAGRIRNAVERVLNEEIYTKNAQLHAELNRLAGGVTRGADIIEKSLANIV